MVFDPVATTETFSPNSRDASQNARVILSRNSVTAYPTATSNLQHILGVQTELSRQVAGTLGEKLWTDLEDLS